MMLPPHKIKSAIATLPIIKISYDLSLPAAGFCSLKFPGKCLVAF